MSLSPAQGCAHTGSAIASIFTIPEGPFGGVTAENFGQPGVTDYRNPNLAEALRALGFVRRFGAGRAIAGEALGNRLRFEIQPGFVVAIIAGVSSKSGPKYGGEAQWASAQSGAIPGIEKIEARLNPLKAGFNANDGGSLSKNTL